MAGAISHDGGNESLSMAPVFEETVFPVPYLLAGSAVYLVIHGVLTIVLAGQLKRGGDSIASEVLVVTPLICLSYVSLNCFLKNKIFATFYPHYLSKKEAGIYK